MDTQDYTKLTKVELVKIAKELDIPGISRMKKEELIDAIMAHETDLHDKKTKADQLKTKKTEAKESTTMSEKKDEKKVTSPKEKSVSSKKPAAKHAEIKETKPKTAPVITVEKKVEIPKIPVAAAKASKKEESHAIPAASEPEKAKPRRMEAPPSAVRAESFRDEELARVDEGIPELPEGYGDNRVVLLPRDPQWLYSYWDMTNEHKELFRQKGGKYHVLRLYDVTNIDFDGRNANAVYEHACVEWARWWYIPVPTPGNSYCIELGYLTESGEWLALARSNTVEAPVNKPSSWVHDVFVTVPFGQWIEPSILSYPEIMTPPPSPATPDLHEKMYQYAQGQAPEGLSSYRVAGSLPPFGSHMAGSRGGTPKPKDKHDFWLTADAELVVYGATESGAKLKIGSETIELRPDGTYSLRLAFENGTIELPISSTSRDEKYSREIKLTFTRKTE